MPHRSSQIDAHLRLTRRLLFAALLSFVAIRLTPAMFGPRGAEPDAGLERILPVVATPIGPAGEGRLIPPFDVDDVDHTTFGWALLDRTAGEVLVVDSAGRPRRRLGRRGAGPGELERPARVALGDATEVVVLDASGQRLDLFPDSGLPLRIPVEAHECRGTFGDDVVRHGGAWWLLRRCFEGLDADIEVLRVTSAGEVERVERRPLTRMNTDPHLVPLLLSYGDNLWAGSNRDACLLEVGAAADDAQRLCLPRPTPIAIPDSLVSEMFGDLARRAAAVGLDLEIPTHYPGLVGARVGASGPVVRTVLADGSDRWAYERRDTLRVASPPADIRIHPGASRWLLLSDEGAGLRIWTVPDSRADPAG